ncbi:ABC transporter permease subunit [Streptomyces sp. NPDC029041]|uniref:ABC transporter permease subunit n=1 Tax=Streptomyces sp. NPDC029041 TaxID=3155727 RepID=UPI0033F31543
MVIFLAGLRQIPEQYYEAAALDSASRRHQFRHVTLPLLHPDHLLQPRSPCLAAHHHRRAARVGGLLKHLVLIAFGLVMVYPTLHTRRCGEVPNSTL